MQPGSDNSSRAARAEEQLGVYISVPFCKAKCSYCNFASGVFAAERMQAYVDRVCAEIAGARLRVVGMGALLPASVDSVYLGGGTPSLLAPEQLRQLFVRLRDTFNVATGAEITIECAPGQISDAVLREFAALGVNRLSFGVQSFIDRESRAVGRLHTGEQCLAEIARVRAAGIAEVNVDLIAGLPHQTEESFRVSLEKAVGSGVPHVSVYMLEVDEDSRLGSELLAGGVRYHAHHVPDDGRTADLYLAACEFLEGAGIAQYEISNFARSGHASLHNLKYWRRQPYLGLGLDAHSMLRAESAFRADSGGNCAVRFANTDDLDAYMAAAMQPEPQEVSAEEALEEALFLGLRLNAGIDLEALRAEFGETVDGYREPIAELAAEGMLLAEGDRVKLTERGRLVSNDVFGRLLETVPA
ncbi:MAG: radical SAM family heme chaperone HemW [Acidobacteriaceae bacterium]